MAVNKVVMNTENGAETLIDLTGDTVTPETLARGATAHDATGNIISGYLLKAETISLGIASDGLIYVFINGEPVGTGIPQGQSGDVFGYVDENNTIVLTGALDNGVYSVKYEMDNGSIIDIGELSFVFSISKNLTYCTISNGATSVATGGSYSATISANSGYAIKSIKVTMGGVDISSTVVNGNNISITNVTGDIVITAVAEVYVPSYTNLFKPSEAIINKRINSSKTLTDANGKMVTNFINVSEKTPFTDNTKIYIKGATFTSDGNTNINTFTTSGTSYTDRYSASNGSALSPVNEGNGVISISNLKTLFPSGIKRMCMTLQVSTSQITTDDIQNIVITIDEPIV